jgi:hypothetical protein
MHVMQTLLEATPYISQFYEGQLQVQKVEIWKTAALVITGSAG